MRRTGGTLCLAALGVASAGSAWAQSSQTLDLRWDAPAVCPTADEVRADVQRLVGDAPAQATLSATAIVENRGEVWQLTLETNLNGQRGERQLEGPTCKSVAGAAALTLALMLNPSPGAAPDDEAPELPAPPPDPLSAAPDEVAAEPMVTKPLPPRLTPQAETRAPAPVGTPRETYVGLTTTLGAGLGNLPALDPELGVGAVFGMERWSFSLSGVYGLPQTSSASGPAAAELSFAAVRLRGCFAALDFAWSLSPCVGLGASILSGRGIQIESPKSGTISWAEFGGGGRLMVPVTEKLAFVSVVGIEGPLVPRSRPRVFIEDVNGEPAEVRRAALLSGHAHVGVQWQLW